MQPATALLVLQRLPAPTVCDGAGGGIQHQCGGTGLSLSGGQRQRLASQEHC